MFSGEKEGKDSTMPSASLWMELPLGIIVLTIDIWYIMYWYNIFRQCQVLLYRRNCLDLVSESRSSSMDNGHANICKDQFLPFMADMLLLWRQRSHTVTLQGMGQICTAPRLIVAHLRREQAKTAPPPHPPTQPHPFPAGSFFLFCSRFTPILKNWRFFAAILLF